jgi:hypothetical protein
MPQQDPRTNPGGMSDRHFVRQNFDAWFAGELSDQDRDRYQEVLDRCAESRLYVESETAFMNAARESMTTPPAQCPSGLREKVLKALDRCEAEMLEEDDSGFAASDKRVHPGKIVQGRMASQRRWWMFASLGAAAALLLAALMLFDSSGSGGGDQGPDLHNSLLPVVANVSLDARTQVGCRYNDAREEYSKHFDGAPELPAMFGDLNARVVDFHCIRMDGRLFMCAVYKAENGSKFALLTFRRECLGGAVPSQLKAAEMLIGDKLVFVWCEGKYLRALVGMPDCTKVLRECSRALRTDDSA